MLAVVPGIMDDTLPRPVDDPFGGVRSLSFVFRSLYAVFTPRLLCFTCFAHTKMKRNGQRIRMTIIAVDGRYPELCYAQNIQRYRKQKINEGNDYT